MRAAASVAAIAVACIVPCLAADDPPAPPPVPKLDIDPTEQIDVRGWWSNGTELLLIQDDGGYRLWRGGNRYLPPSDIGRWDRQTYRTLWLETYRGSAHSRDRAHLRREDGVLLLSLRDLEPMKPLARPPRTREDTLVGTWSGPPGSLSLRDDGTYAFTVAKAGPQDRQPVRMGSHVGTWMVKEDAIVLGDGRRTLMTAAIVVPEPAPAAARPPTAVQQAPGTAPPATAPPMGVAPGAAPGQGAAPSHSAPTPDGTRLVLPGGELQRERPAAARAS